MLAICLSVFFMEGTMSTEFLYREKDCSGCETKSDLLLSLGGFMSGPRALRPERLQWLTTSAANRQAFMRNKMWSLGVGLIAQAAPNRSIHEVDTVRSGALEDLPYKSINVASLTQVWVHFLSQNSASGPSLDGTFPPSFTKLESGACLR